MVAYPGTGTQKIYAGTYNNRSGCEVWSYDGTWSKLIGSGLPDNPPSGTAAP